MAATSRTMPLVQALVLLVILIAVNLLSSRVYTRWDLTENREYTLSPATKNVLDRLDDVINVHVYFSKELPSYFATLDRQVKDLLDEYRAYGGGRVQIEFVDPASDPILEQTMQRLGIPKLQLTRYERERAEAMNAYLGISIQYEDQTEVIPVVQQVDRLEYDLTAAVVKVSTEPKTVGIATAGNVALPDDLRGLQELIRQQYSPRTVDVNAGEVPMEVTSLVVVDDDGYTEEGLYNIDQFLMRGGKIFFLASGVDVNLTNLFARNREVKVGTLLRTYGVGVQSALVVDAQAPLVSFDVGTFFPLSLRYPWFPQVVETGLSAENPITGDMKTLVLPWTSPLTVLPPDTATGVPLRVDVLASSSERSFAKTAPYDLNPQSRVTLPQTGVEPQTLALALTGSFRSHWGVGDPIPGDSLGVAPRGPEQSPETQIVVVGSSSFLTSRFLQQYPSNGLFLANAVDWMTLGNDLIAIRSRTAVNRPLREVEENRRGLLKALAVFPVPVLVIVFGLVRARLRVTRRTRYALEFKGAA